MDIFDDILPEEEAGLQAQFRTAMENAVKKLRPMKIYAALHIERETGRKYAKGKIPIKRPRALRRLLLDAVSPPLSFEITYRDQKLTPEHLRRAPDEYKQLELFDHAGFLFEVSRKKSARGVLLELRIREA